MLLDYQKVFERYPDIYDIAKEKLWRPGTADGSTAPTVPDDDAIIGYMVTYMTKLSDILSDTSNYDKEKVDVMIKVDTGLDQAAAKSNEVMIQCEKALYITIDKYKEVLKGLTDATV